MSTARGNTSRKRPQKHQNRTAFKNDLHDSSHKTKFINSLQISGVCKRCKDILDWKIKYKKYKPLSAPRKCITCEQKNIKHAYHMMCGKCAAEKKVCAKCCKPFEIELISEDDAVNLDADLMPMLKELPERKRRTILRFINKHRDQGQKIPPEIMSHVEELVSKMDKVNFDDDSFFDETFSDSDDN